MSGRSRRLSFFSMKYRAIIHFPLSELDHKYLMEIVVLLQIERWSLLNLTFTNKICIHQNLLSLICTNTGHHCHCKAQWRYKSAEGDNCGWDLTTDCLDLVSLFIFSSLCLSFLYYVWVSHCFHYIFAATNNCSWWLESDGGWILSPT